MQSNIYTSKIIKPSKAKQETSENSVKTAYKGKTWKRGTDKRTLKFDGLQGVYNDWVIKDSTKRLQEYQHR